MAEKPEFIPGRLEVAAAILFILAVVGALGLAITGVIDPLTAGLILTTAMALVFLGYYLVRQKIIPSHMLPFWYILIIGVALLMYGGIQQGFIPVFLIAGTPANSAVYLMFVITESVLYALLVVVPLTVIFGLYYAKKKGYLKL